MAKRETTAHSADVNVRASNPIVALARRIMEPLLSDVRDRVVVDIGCGSGQDLELVISRGARAVGLDFVPEILREAANKKNIRTRLVQADVRNLPLQERSADLVICSFVLKYVNDLQSLADELARIVLPNADIYVMDMHPEAQRHGWRAALDSTVSDVPVNVHELTRIRQAFDAAGFELELLLEPRLGHPERRHFEMVQRPDLFEEARRVPAMYLFHFRRRMLTADRNRPHVVPRRRQRSWHLTGARLALGPHTAIHADVVMNASRIRGIYDRPSKSRAQLEGDDVVVDLSGLLLLPGLINAHDHLQAGWPSRVLPEVAPWLGALRNFFSGVTTAFHDEVWDATGTEQFPLRLARNGAHSAKQTVQEIAADFEGTSPDDLLVIDIAWCGNEPGKFLQALNGKGLLTERTVLVGAADFDLDSQKLLQEKETAVVWSPTRGRLRSEFATNQHLIALGTDGTGKCSLADEIQAALKMGVPPEAIYSMLTSRPASILRLRNGEGRIVADTPADILAVKDSGATPAQALCALPQSPLAVLVGGRPMLVDDGLLERIPESLREPLRAFSVGDAKWWAEEHLVAAVRGAHRSGAKIRIGGESVKA